MGGTSKQQSSQSQSSQTNPWAPTQGPLNQIIGQISGQLGSSAPTGAENAAIDQLSMNAQQGNQFAPQINQLAKDLFAGGPDRTGMVNQAYSDYQTALNPFASGQFVDPSQNPALRGYLDTISSDIQNRVNAQFAGAGRDMSGMNQGAIARGITEGTAPVLLNAYNAERDRQLGAINSLYGAGNTTAGLLSNLDQNAFANRGAGVAAAEQAMTARDAGPTGVLNAESMRRNLPLSNISNLLNLILPIAGLGGQSQGTGTSNTTNQMSGAQQFALISGGLRNLFPGQG